MGQKAKKIIINCVLIAVILGIGAWVLSLFVHLGNVEYTNNAQVKQDLVAVNCRVQGYVKKIYVGEFQQVHRGDTLMVIEDTEFILHVKQAEAALARARAGQNVQNRAIATVGNAEHISQANLDEVRIRMEHAKVDFDRYSNLMQKGAVTREQYDQKKTEYEALKARYESLANVEKGSKLTTHEQRERLTLSGPEIEAAEAALDLAKLNLSYTVITAPCDGYTSRKLIQEGELMQPGKLAFTLVNTEDVWIIANFKESQMQHIDLGSVVNITVDAIQNAKFQGKVIAISDATGAQYSATPTDNSAGNFVKVEGRIPVKISIESATPQEALKKLRSGLNAELEVIY